MNTTKRAIILGTLSRRAKNEQAELYWRIEKKDLSKLSYQSQRAAALGSALQLIQTNPAGAEEATRDSLHAAEAALDKLKLAGADGFREISAAAGLAAGWAVAVHIWEVSK